MSTIFELAAGDRATFANVNSGEEVTINVTGIGPWVEGGFVINSDERTLRVWDGWSLVEILSYAGGIPNADMFSWTNQDGDIENAVRYLAASDRLWRFKNKYISTVLLAEIVNGAETFIVQSHR